MAQLTLGFFGIQDSKDIEVLRRTLDMLSTDRIAVKIEKTERIERWLFPNEDIAIDYIYIANNGETKNVIVGFKKTRKHRDFASIPTVSTTDISSEITDAPAITDLSFTLVNPVMSIKIEIKIRIRKHDGETAIKTIVKKKNKVIAKQYHETKVTAPNAYRNLLDIEKPKKVIS